MTHTLFGISSRLPRTTAEYDRLWMDDLVHQLEMNFGVLVRLPRYLQGLWIPLSTVTASAGTDIEFASVMDSTYDLYIVYLYNILPGTATDDLYCQVSPDGSTYRTDYQYGFAPLHSDLSYGYGVSYSPTTGATQSETQLVLASDLGNAAGEGLSGFIFIDEPSATKKLKIRTDLSYTDNDDDWIHITGGGRSNTNEAVTSIKFYASTGTITGSARLFGVNK